MKQHAGRPSGWRNSYLLSTVLALISLENCEVVMYASESHIHLLSIFQTTRHDTKICPYHNDKTANLTMASSNSYEQQNQQQGGQPRPLQMGAKGAYIVRLLMVGDSSCGKTSLVLRFDQNVFSTKFVTTIGVDYRDKMVKVSRFNFC